MTLKYSGTIRPGQARTLEAKAGDNLRVLSGRLWLTQSGSLLDHFLTPGDSLCLGPDKTVIEADSQHGACFEVCSPEPAAPARISLRFRDNRAHEFIAKTCGI